MRFRITSLIMIVLALTLISKSPLFHPAPIADRTIQEVEAVADYITENNLIDANQPIAVVAAVSQNTEVPQADDYRYLLRNRGYSVVDVTHHPQANQLVYVIEVPDFDWQQWSNWEIQSFGDKTVKRLEHPNDNTTIVVFEKK